MNNNTELQNYINDLKSGNRFALAKCISVLENGGKQAQELIRLLPSAHHSSYTIGITGAPGVGKSTLINAFTKILRQNNKKVAVIATDPTSPFSGGAILGDRIRMNDHAGDPGVFIRSLGSRGNPDGLSTYIPYILQLLQLAEIDYALLETVGSGQLDVMVKVFADTTFLLLSPEGGDEIQMMKAGILEIADIMIINKSDRKGCELIETQLQTWLDLLPKSRTWKPPIIKAQSNSGVGMPELYEALTKHRLHRTSKQNDGRDLEHRRLMVMNLAVAMFRGACEELLAQKELAAVLNDNSNNAVILAQRLIDKFKESSR